MVLLENADCLFVIFVLVRYSFLLLCDLLVIVTVSLWLQSALW